jgi:SPOR domain
MTDVDNDGVRDEEDRLPWLEAVDDEDEGVSTGKLAAFLIAALLALGAVIGGVAWLRSHQPGAQGDGKLIAAAEGDYKVRPDTPGGMKVEGQGDTAFKASEGAAPKGKIDLNATSETPVAGTKMPKLNGPAAPMGKNATAPMPANGGKLVAAVARGGGLVQLGAFSSEAKANQTWVSLAKRYAYLAPLGKSVEAAQVGGGTVYRLRANAGGDAGTVCGKLRVAGESCMVVN